MKILKTGIALLGLLITSSSSGARRAPTQKDLDAQRVNLPGTSFYKVFDYAHFTKLQVDLGESFLIAQAVEYEQKITRVTVTTLRPDRRVQRETFRLPKALPVCNRLKGQS